MEQSPPGPTGHDCEHCEQREFEHSELMNFLVPVEKHLKAIRGGINFFVALTLVAIVAAFLAQIMSVR